MVNKTRQLTTPSPILNLSWPDSPLSPRTYITWRRPLTASRHLSGRLFSDDGFGSLPRTIVAAFARRVIFSKAGWTFVVHQNAVSCSFAPSKFVFDSRCASVKRQLRQTNDTLSSVVMVTSIASHMKKTSGICDHKYRHRKVRSLNLRKGPSSNLSIKHQRSPVCKKPRSRMHWHLTLFILIYVYSFSAKAGTQTWRHDVKAWSGSFFIPCELWRSFGKIWCKQRLENCMF